MWADGSEGERHFANIWQWLKPKNAIDPMREFQFDPNRKFRFDFAWPEAKLAIEIEGGVWSEGRHVRGRGYTDDLEKYNLATLHDWRILRFTPQMLADDPHEVISMVLKGLGIADAD